MLLPTEVDLVSQEKSYKRDSIWFGGFIGGKMVFTLLAEVITLHMGSIIVDVWGLGLELISRSRSTLQEGLEEHLNDSVQVPLAITINVNIIGRWSLKGSKRSLRRSRRSLVGSRFI